MSNQIGIIASLPIAPGKLAKMQAHFEEVFKYLQANEPGTLEFTVYKQENENGTTLLLHERYASPEALAKHRNSEHYAAAFETMSKENMLAGEPIIMEGSWFQGLKQ